MPQVGNKKFPYTEEGELQAEIYAAETGQDVVQQNSYGYSRGMQEGGYEPEYKDSGMWEKNFLTRYISSLVPALGITGANLGIAYSVLKDPRRPAEHASIIKEMRAKAPKGVKFRNVDFKNPKSMMDMMTGMPHYDPNLDRVTTGQWGKTPHSGIMAHELGHQQQYAGPKPTTALNKISGISRRIGPLAALPLLIADKESTAKTWAGVGTAVQAPTFVHEMDASMKGRKILMDAAAQSGNKLGLIKSLGSFKGIPSYLLALASPYLIYKWLKMRGQYETPEEPEGMQAGGMMAKKLLKGLGLGAGIGGGAMYLGNEGEGETFTSYPRDARYKRLLRGEEIPLPGLEDYVYGTNKEPDFSGGAPGHEGAARNLKYEIDIMTKPYLQEYLKAGVDAKKAYWLSLIDIGIDPQTKYKIAEDSELQTMFSGLFKSNNINYLDLTHHRQSRSRLGLESPHLDAAEQAEGKQRGGFVGSFGF